VETGGYRMAWVSYAEHDEQKTVRPVAHFGFEDSFLQLRRSWAEADEAGHGPNATAIRTGQAVVVRDVASDPIYAFWRDEAAKRGYASVIALPLLLDDQVLGALSIYAPEPDAFDAAEVDLLTELAEDLSYGIGALRTRAKQKDAEETIRRMAYYDALSGLPNRAKLKLEMQQVIASARKQNRPFPLLILDLDRFREINEGLGYAEGDKLLQQVGRRIEESLKTGELVAHLGEDEFAVLIPRGDAEYAQNVARRVLKALGTPFELSGFTVDMCASIGIALFPGHGADPDALILRAETAMARTKRSNADYTIYTGAPGQEHTRRLALIRDLNHAIREHQLLFYCQPKVNIGARRVCGAEALVRWRHPELGMISLSELIPLAEQTGQIKPLTYWMVDAALRQCHAWSQEGFDMPLAVNVSVRNLREPAFLDRISGLLQTWGTGAGLFQLELTESALMEDPAGALEVLNRLHEMGIELNVDDFGTGYSSLSYLDSR
jgi:diguanylate cyclase (GGDEF)-like protein